MEIPWPGQSKVSEAGFMPLWEGEDAAHHPQVQRHPPPPKAGSQKAAGRPLWQRLGMPQRIMGTLVQLTAPKRF